MSIIVNYSQSTSKSYLSITNANNWQLMTRATEQILVSFSIKIEKLFWIAFWRSTHLWENVPWLTFPVEDFYSARKGPTTPGRATRLTSLDFFVGYRHLGLYIQAYIEPVSRSHNQNAVFITFASVETVGGLLGCPLLRQPEARCSGRQLCRLKRTKQWRSRKTVGVSPVAITYVSLSNYITPLCFAVLSELER